MSAEQIEAYEGEAEVYSDPWGLLDRNNRNHRKKQAIIIDRTAAQSGDTVLEVGCGNGLHAVGYDQRYTYYGVDLSQSLVEETQRQIGSGVVTQANAMDLPYESNTFDAVVGCAILHHLNDYEQAIQEWQRVVKPGGSVTLMEPNPVFPKDFLSLFTQEKEQHKWKMFPWRIAGTLDQVTESFDLEPKIYTPPIPERFEDVFDAVDSVGEDLPGARWLSQMLLIHVEV